MQFIFETTLWEKDITRRSLLKNNDKLLYIKQTIWKYEQHFQMQLSNSYQQFFIRFSLFIHLFWQIVIWVISGDDKKKQHYFLFLSDDQVVTHFQF